MDVPGVYHNLLSLFKKESSKKLSHIFLNKFLPKLLRKLLFDFPWKSFNIILQSNNSLLVNRFAQFLKFSFIWKEVLEIIQLTFRKIVQNITKNFRKVQTRTCFKFFYELHEIFFKYLQGISIAMNTNIRHKVFDNRIFEIL